MIMRFLFLYNVITLDSYLEALSAKSNNCIFILGEPLCACEGLSWLSFIEFVVLSTFPNIILEDLSSKDSSLVDVSWIK